MAGTANHGTPYIQQKAEIANQGQDLTNSFTANHGTHCIQQKASRANQMRELRTLREETANQVVDLISLTVGTAKIRADTEILIEDLIRLLEELATLMELTLKIHTVVDVNQLEPRISQCKTVEMVQHTTVKTFQDTRVKIR